MDIDKLESFVNSLGLDYHAEFVPFSKSRNKKEKPAIRDLCINWKVTISKGNCSLTVDYQEGIGLQAPTNRILKDYNKVTIDQYNQLMCELETGAGLKAPLLIDVLYSLCLDSSVMDYPDFEEWCGGFGYDSDSRKAFKIYNECLAAGLKLNYMLGKDKLTYLQELFQDYEEVGMSIQDNIEKVTTLSSLCENHLIGGVLKIEKHELF